MRIEIKATDVFYHMLDSQKRYIAEIGGRGSSKSFSTCQYLTYKMIKQPGARILAIRKSLPSARLSVQNMFLNVMFPLFGISDMMELRFMERFFKLVRNNSLLHVTSIYNLEEAKKLKSTEWNYIWVEEGIEQSLAIINELDQILRAPHPDDAINQLIITANPDDEYSDLKTEIIDKDFKKEWDIMYSNWENNEENLPKEYIAMLLGLKDKSPDLYRVFTLGKWGKISGLIYDNIRVINESALPEQFDEIGYGLDFGYNNPSALLEIGIKDQIPYILKEFKQSHLTNPELIEILKEFVTDRQRPIFADPARPDLIEEIARAGFNIDKADNDVIAGIAHNKANQVYVLGTCTEFIKESRHYVCKAAKGGVMSDLPVKFEDHLMDAWRYFHYTNYRRKGEVYVI